MPASQCFAGGALDRAAHLRTDDAWLDAAWKSADARVVPVWRSRILLHGAAEGRPGAVLPPPSWADPVRAADLGLAWAFLGLLANAPVFALDLGLDEPAALLPAGAGFHDLRTVAGALSADDAALLATARAMMTWRARHRFCGVCGGACRAERGGHLLVCTLCAAQHFPRTDPAVIMLVTRGSRALLGHSVRFPDRRVYSTLAGFVEPGESLEQAVAREVREETAVEIGAPVYRSSQPWPFPSNLMLGFHAEALTEDIRIDPDELTDAAWFTRDQLRDPAAHSFALPPPISIARRLIDEWLDE